MVRFTSQSNPVTTKAVLVRAQRPLPPPLSPVGRDKPIAGRRGPPSRAGGVVPFSSLVSLVNARSKLAKRGVSIPGLYGTPLSLTTANNFTTGTPKGGAAERCGNMDDNIVVLRHDARPPTTTRSRGITLDHSSRPSFPCFQPFSGT